MPQLFAAAGAGAAGAGAAGAGASMMSAGTSITGAGAATSTLGTAAGAGSGVLGALKSGVGAIKGVQDTLTPQGIAGLLAEKAPGPIGKFAGAIQNSFDPLTKNFDIAALFDDKHQKQNAEHRKIIEDLMKKGPDGNGTLSLIARALSNG